MLDKGVAVDGAVTVAKMVHTLPSNWADCVAQGRVKFEKYFNHKVGDKTYSVSLALPYVMFTFT